MKFWQAGSEEQIILQRGESPSTSWGAVQAWFNGCRLFLLAEGKVPSDQQISAFSQTAREVSPFACTIAGSILIFEDNHSLPEQKKWPSSTFQWKTYCGGVRCLEYGDSNWLLIVASLTWLLTVSLCVCLRLVPSEGTHGVGFCNPGWSICRKRNTAAWKCRVYVPPFRFTVASTWWTGSTHLGFNTPVRGWG